MVAELAEVLWTQPEQCCAVELRVPPDVVVHLRWELTTVLVGSPELRRPDTCPLDEHSGGVPVVTLARQVVPAFEQEDSLAEGAMRWANVPPPAPVPITMTS